MNAKLEFAAALIRDAMPDAAKHAKITATDNLMSSVTIHGSLDAKETWANGIFHNSRYFIFHVVSARGRRWYDSAVEPLVRVELISSGSKLPKFRAWTGTPEKAAVKIANWVEGAAWVTV